MTLRTFFKNLFAPDSEAKPLYTPLDLRLLEHYEAWQKNREEGKKKERIERSELYQVLFQDNDREDAREEKNRRFFDQLIAQSTCLRAATVEDYNEWMTDWLQTGESITYYSGNPFSTWQVHYVQDPDTWVSLSQDRRYGASFPERSQYVFIIPKQYDCRDYLSAFCVENNAVYGWSNNEPGIYGKGSPSNRDDLYVPAFSDTVDQQMCQRAQAALEHCAEGERPEVDALDLRVFQEKDTYMRRQREMLARHTAQRTFDDLERAQLIAAAEEAERLEKLTLSNADSARPATMLIMIGGWRRGCVLGTRSRTIRIGTLMSRTLSITTWLIPRQISISAIGLHVVSLFLRSTTAGNTSISFVSRLRRWCTAGPIINR